MCLPACRECRIRVRSVLSPISRFVCHPLLRSSFIQLLFLALKQTSTNWTIELLVLYLHSILAFDVELVPFLFVNRSNLMSALPHFTVSPHVMQPNISSQWSSFLLMWSTLGLHHRKQFSFIGLPCSKLAESHIMTIDHH